MTQDILNKIAAMTDEELEQEYFDSATDTSILYEMGDDPNEGEYFFAVQDEMQRRGMFEGK